MKTKNIILIALLVLLTGLVSCKKDHDIPSGKVFNGGSGGGSTTDSLTISVTANPSEGGTVSGGGTYQQGQQCTLTAVANANYSFSNWTEDGIQVSASANYTFTVDGNRNLVANFSGFGGGTGKTVLIKDFTGARGVNCPAAIEYAHNLQHQLDEDHIFIMSVHAGYLAQPMGNFPDFLTDEGTAWYNNHDSNPLFAVDHVALTDGNTLNEGQIDAPVTESLLEEQSFEILVNPQYDETNRQLQVEVQAIALENLDGQFYITACLVEDHIIGWQTTPGGVDKEYDFRNVFRGTLNGAYGEEFGSSHVNSNDNYNFNYNCEINADFNADECYLIVYVYDKSQGDKILQTAIAKIKQSVSSNFTISVSANPSDGGTVTGGGIYQQGQTCTVTALAGIGYTFVKWTENGSQVSTEESYTFTVTGNRNLVANFTFCDYSYIILNEINGDTKFIEIYNKGDLDLSMEGMYIMKDDYIAGATWTADATIVAPAGGYVLLYSEDVILDHPEHPEALIFHSGLSSKKSIRVTLFMPDGTVRDELTRGTTGEWGQAISDVAPQSYARTPNGGDWKLANPTPGEANPSTGEDIPDVETPVNYTVTVSANPSNGGTVTGGGTYQQGQTCTVTAIANEAYTFTNWTENGNQVSEDAIYTFVVTSNRTLIANYTYQGEGSGTFEDPYNVAAGISLQSEEPIAWVHGYIVGAVKSGLSSVTSNADINWSAPFDLATNVVIADDVTCREISQCIIVNLPAGKPLRTQVNLMDNPTNLGKHLAVLGKLRPYFGQSGLRDSSGTEDDFVLSW